MARALIVDRAGREPDVRAALAARNHAVRTVDAEPLLPGHVFAEFEGVTAVCWLMGSGRVDPEANGQQLETLLAKIVDSGVRGAVVEVPPGEQANAHVDHARATWHIPVELVPAGEGREWAAAVADAFDRVLAA